MAGSSPMGHPRRFSRIPTSSGPTSEASASMLEVKNIECCYGKVGVLHKVSLDVSAGEFVALIGANGAGKSTTLKSISGLLPAVRGSIAFEGEDITNASPRRILELGIAHCPEGRRV